MLVLVMGATTLYAAPALDPEHYVRQQGWKRYEGKPSAKALGAELVPVMFYDKGNAVPSCGLLTGGGAGSPPGFIELVGSEPGVNFPQCLDLVAITPFRMRNLEYVAVEYRSRETREDIERGFHYLVRDPVKGFLTDEALTGAVPSMPLELPAATSIDAVRIARSAALARDYPQWGLVERDFISDNASSFAVFEDRKAQQCHFVAEAGGAPLAFSQAVFFPAAACAGVLASSRYERSGVVYYLVMFTSRDKQRLVAVTSVAADGKITAEKSLSDAIQRAGDIRDMRTAKAALAKGLQ
ncbi:hypothetical protein [Massilia sp. DD77]|uniref:hypothetical protein n=1 Tax=Massilia sp. DD77 TaxID=3109349 RepID=UPI003000A496